MVDDPNSINSKKSDKCANRKRNKNIFKLINIFKHSQISSCQSITVNIYEIQPSDRKTNRRRLSNKDPFAAQNIKHVMRNENVKIHAG